MFAVHYLDDPINGDTQTLDGWSYVWAGLLGPIYVLIKGFPMRAIAMLAICLAIAGTAVGIAIVFAIGWQDTEATTIVIVILAMVAVMTQAVIGVEMVRRGFLDRGYREGYY